MKRMVRRTGLQFTDQLQREIRKKGERPQKIIPTINCCKDSMSALAEIAIELAHYVDLKKIEEYKEKKRKKKLLRDQERAKNIARQEMHRNSQRGRLHQISASQVINLADRRAENLQKELPTKKALAVFVGT